MNICQVILYKRWPVICLAIWAGVARVRADEIARVRDSAGEESGSVSYELYSAIGQGHPIGITTCDSYVWYAGFLNVDASPVDDPNGVAAKTIDAAGGGMTNMQYDMYSAVCQGHPIGVNSDNMHVNYAGFLGMLEYFDGPILGAYGVQDARAIINEVTDQALCTGEAEAEFTFYHILGMKMAGSSYDLINPAGTVVKSNESFAVSSPIMFANRFCQKFAATVPSIFPATLGVYTARVTAVSSNGMALVGRTTYTPSLDIKRAGQKMVFTVLDEDALPPCFNTSRETLLRFDGVSADSEATAVMDSMLTNGLSISNRLYDTQSGLLSTSVQFRVRDPEGWDSGQVNFVVRPEDGGARTNAFDDAVATTVAIDDYDVQLTNGSGRALGVWTCTYHAVDFDNDRFDDGAETDVDVTMQVIDDDSWGPRMTNVQCSGGIPATLIATGFEAQDGWMEQADSNWTNTASDGGWIGMGAQVNSLNGKGAEGFTAGNNAELDAADDYLQLPPLNQPGWLTVWARNSETNGAAQWLLEWLDGETWSSLGAQYVTGTMYNEYNWLITVTNTAVVLRLRMVEASGAIYFDDLVVTPYRAWTNRSGMTVTWDQASDELTGNSGVGEYRQMPLGTTAPMYSTNGVSLGSATMITFTATAELQGVVTGYVFAVDNDQDRGVRDRAMGLPIPTIARLDITPPTAVPMNMDGASTDDVDDPTSQFDLSWNPADVGPDDPDHANYPSWGDNNRNLFSPWKTYKIYYGPFDPALVPDGDPGWGNGNAYIYTNFIQTGVYSNDPSWKCVVATNQIADPSAPCATAYANLSCPSIDKMRLYDLEYDREYVVVIVGVDAAGNEGPASAVSWATNSTIKFSMIRGETMNKSEAQVRQPSANLTNENVDTASALYWIAAGTTSNKVDYSSVSRDYDLICWDSSRFQESSNNAWQLIGTVRTNWFVDDGGQFRPRGQIRFYRSSYKDRWRRTNALGEVQRPLASEEVYALHNVVLSGGRNFLALHGVPYTNTFQAVFGATENFPGGSNALPASGSTIVEFYSPGTNAPLADAYWMSVEGKWLQIDSGMDVTTNLMPPDFFNRGFSIVLPDPLPANYVTTTAIDAGRLDTNGVPLVVPAMMWSPLMRVPTNGFSQVITTGSRAMRPNVIVYNLAALRLPVSAHPGQMRLLESGFVNGRKGQSDEIYTINTSTKQVLSGSTIYCDSSGVWRFVANDALVPAGYFKPNDVIVIVSRNGGIGQSWTWSYRPDQFYDMPTRWMGN